MQTSNANQSFSSGDLGWVLLAELSLSDFLPDQDRREEPATGFLFQSLRELGMSPESMQTIAGRLAGFAKEAWARHKQDRMEFPGRIRIFCQNKIVNKSNSAKPARSSQAKPDKNKNKFFLIPG